VWALPRFWRAASKALFETLDACLDCTSRILFQFAQYDVDWANQVILRTLSRLDPGAGDMLQAHLGTLILHAVFVNRRFEEWRMPWLGPRGRLGERAVMRSLRNFKEQVIAPDALELLPAHPARSLLVLPFIPQPTCTAVSIHRAPMLGVPLMPNLRHFIYSNASIALLDQVADSISVVNSNASTLFHDFTANSCWRLLNRVSPLAMKCHSNFIILVMTTVPSEHNIYDLY
jgi:hypothetical protein